MTIRDQDAVNVTSACRLLGVSRSGYHLWIKRSPTDPDPKDNTLRAVIQEIALMNACYGYRRITRELERREIKVNHKRVLRIMREDNLLCVKKRFKPQTTDSNHALRVYPNLAKILQVTGLNQLWVADITYVRLIREFVYLAAVLDVHSRRCIGWSLSRSIDTQLALDALKEALKLRENADLTGLIHHSDRGVQYASLDYVNTLKDHGIQPSMSRKGNPYDNAFAESFMKTLKKEEVYMQEYEDFDDAYENIRAFIEEVYNARRLHSSIGYIPPIECEQKTTNNNPYDP